MSHKKRIVITGMGIVSCLGNDVDIFYQKLLDGISGVSTLDPEFNTSDFPVNIAACIKDFDPGDYIDKKQARRIDKFMAYTMVAGKKALEMAKLNENEREKLDKTRCGILIGSGMGGMSVFVDGVHTMKEKGFKRVSPFFIPYILSNMGGGLFGIELGFMGPNYSISTACATSNNSIISAANHILNGDCDLMICGGSEAAILPIGLVGFNACRALSTRCNEPTKASRPWDKNRDGFVMGEGAGVLILESLEHAIARGAPILAEYLGSGISCDAHHITEPHPEGKGVTLCIKNALKNAGIDESQVDHINAHATSTPAGDMAEVTALKKVFSQPEKIAMTSTKSMIGHCLGAAGAIEAIATIKAITDQIVHPTLNLENPEPDLDFFVPTQAKKWNIQIAISNSFGFGGHNATIVLGKYGS